jgi:hypothetical protein
MESQISGLIQYEQISDSRALRRFADQQIKKWIYKRHPKEPGVSAKYLVDLKREGAGHTFICQIVIKLGNQIWAGYQYKGTLHQALIRCLDQLVPVTAPAV